MTTGGIFDAFTTDTGSDDSFLASLEHDVGDLNRRRKCFLEAPTTPNSLSSRGAAVDATERSMTSLTELRVVPTQETTANCIDAAINHHITVSALVDSDSVSATVDAFNASQHCNAAPGDVAAS